MDTPEIDESQEAEQVTLQEDLESAYDDAKAEPEAEPEVEVEAEAQQEALEALVAPNMWGKDAKAGFDYFGGIEGGREHLEAILNQATESQGYTTQKEQEAAQHKEAAEGWDKIFEPFQQQMNLQGTDGPAFMRQLLGYYQQLNSNPAETIQGLAKNYNLDLATLGQDAPYQSPSETAQAQRIDQLERAHQNSMLQARNRETDGINQQIQSFANEQSASGESLHPHFETVQNTMTQLIQGGAAKDLSNAYEMACKLNPDLTAQTKAQEIADNTAQKADKAKKAKAAAKRTTGTQAGSSKSNMTMKEQIEAEYDKQAAA